MREWNMDPAASGTRYRCFVGDPAEFVLCVYEDGRWFVDHPAGTVVANGDAKDMSQAMRLCVAVLDDYQNMGPKVWHGP